MRDQSQYYHSRYYHDIQYFFHINLESTYSLFYSYSFLFILIFQQSLTTNRSRCFRFSFPVYLPLSLRAIISTENSELSRYYVYLRFTITLWLLNERCSFSVRFSDCLWITVDCNCEFVNNELATNSFIRGGDSSRLIYVYIYI